MKSRPDKRASLTDYFLLIHPGIYIRLALSHTFVALKTPTLADKLGMPASNSPLLRKAKQLGLASSGALETLAVMRGCWHYRSPGLAPGAEVPETEFSDEELAVALLSPSLAYSPHSIRIGAAMLGATGNDVQTLTHLAVAEQAVSCVRYIASAALHFEPGNRFWRQLLDELPDTPPVPDGVMPHPTRFVSMTGFTRQGPGRVTVWIRPRPELAALHGD